MSKPNPSAIYAHRRAALKPGNENLTLEEFSQHAFLESLDKPSARSSLRSAEIYAARRAACTLSRNARGKGAGR